LTNGDTHRKTIGYILWIFGFSGSHHFYYGKPVTGTLSGSSHSVYWASAGLSTYF